MRLLCACHVRAMCVNEDCPVEVNSIPAQLKSTPPPRDSCRVFGSPWPHFVSFFRI